MLSSVGCWVAKRRQPNLLVANSLREIHRFTTPIGGQYELANIPVDAAVRPLDGTCDVPVLDRVVMDVIDMATEILVIADPVLPISPLPNGLFPFALPAGEYYRSLGGWDSCCEGTLDVALPHGIIGISFGQ